MNGGGALRRAALVVSGGILVSRLLGFLRDVTIAGLLGRSTDADLYAAAFFIPDYLFFLMAGGYLTITLVPILARHLAEGDEEQARVAFTAVFRVVAVVLVVVTVIAIIMATPLTALLFPRLPDRMRLAGLTRIALASQVFFGMGTLLMAAQYARQRFVVPSLAPVVYNLGIITGGVVGALLGDPAPEAFLWGGLVGAAVGNFALQWWGASRSGFRLVGRVAWRHSAVIEYFSLALPLMIGQSVVALDEQWPRLFGQLVDAGATSGLAYARRLNMLPVGVIAQAAGVAAYPFLARLYAAGDREGLAGTVRRSARSAAVVAGLAAAITAGSAGPIVRLALQRGQFGSLDTEFVAPLLAAYAVSIPFWAVHQVVTRAFYATRRMWLPVGVGTAATLVTVPVLFVAASRGAVAVALVSSLSVAAYTVAITLLWGRSEAPSYLGRLGAKVGLATVAAAAAGFGVSRLLGWETAVRAAAALSGGVLTSGAVYLAVARLIGVGEISDVLTGLRAKRAG